MTPLKAPFPYFGGKPAIASIVWERFGRVPRYIEPFAGSLAVMLARPRPFDGREIVNDSDGLLVNLWRALAADPEAVAHHADWPAMEVDMHARHAWLVGERPTITTRLEGDPDWFDAKAAGWWLWGIGLWIGGGWCSGDGPWRVTEVDLNDGQGIHRQLLHAGNDGRGIHRQHLARRDGGILAAIEPLTQRLRDALVMCGDWTRVVTPAVMLGSGRGRAPDAVGACGVFLDPPYAHAERTTKLYAHDQDIAESVREWAIANGDDRRLRIALAGYEDGRSMPDGWTEVAWTARGGMGNQSTKVGNRGRERLWFSPHCEAAGLWDVRPADPLFSGGSLPGSMLAESRGRAE